MCWLQRGVDFSIQGEHEVSLLSEIPIASQKEKKITSTTLSMPGLSIHAHTHSSTYTSRDREVWIAFSHNQVEILSGRKKNILKVKRKSHFEILLVTLASFVFLALHAAALSGHVSTVKLLLDNDAQVDATDVMKHTPLFRACEMGHKDVIQTLIKGWLIQELLLGLTQKVGILARFV